jgi:transposase
MVPIPSEAEEEARRAHREREDLLGERRSLLNRIDGILATLGVVGFKGLRRDRRKQLADLRQPDGAKVPVAAHSRIERLVERLELVMAQIAAVEAARDAVVEKETPADTSERMIRDLSRVSGIGVETATLLVREAFCRNFANRRALGSYAGLTATPFASGSMVREQGISKDGNRRLRACLVELAWFWLRYQRESGLARWFCARVNGAKGRVAKIMIVALARKLLIALWRFANEGVIPEGATMKAA